MFPVDKKFEVDIEIKYLASDKDAKMLDDGSWSLWYKDPWEVYKIFKCKNMEQAMQYFLVNYGKEDHIDMEILIEYIYDDKVVGDDYIENLPSINGIADQVALLKYKSRREEIDMLNEAYYEFGDILSLQKDQKESIKEFTNRCLENNKAV
jgi:hypothetical protein